MKTSKSKSTYIEAQQLALKTKWKTSICGQGSSCWCRLITPKTKIKDKDGNEIYIAGSGCVSKIFAEYIVELHNKNLDNNK